MIRIPLTYNGILLGIVIEAVGEEFKGEFSLVLLTPRYAIAFRLVIETLPW